MEWIDTRFALPIWAILKPDARGRHSRAYSVARKIGADQMFAVRTRFHFDTKSSGRDLSGSISMIRSTQKIRPPDFKASYEHSVCQTRCLARELQC
jgi:hypothetical protein